MVKLSVTDSVDFGPVVTQVKGIRGGREWVANQIRWALVHDLSVHITLRWGAVDIPECLHTGGFAAT